MSVRTQMKRFGALAIQIRERKELSNEQLDYLAEAFEKISQGYPADIALALRHETGQSESKEVSVEEPSGGLHLFQMHQLPALDGACINVYNREVSLV